MELRAATLISGGVDKHAYFMGIEGLPYPKREKNAVLPKKEMDASPSVATGKIKSWRYCAKSLTIRRKHHSFVKVFSETFFR